MFFFEKKTKKIWLLWTWGVVADNANDSLFGGSDRHSYHDFLGSNESRTASPTKIRIIKIPPSVINAVNPSQGA